MIAIKQLTSKNKITLECKVAYMPTKKYTEYCAMMFTNNFRLSKINRMFVKNYIDIDYAWDRVDRDLAMLKKFFGFYKIEKFNLTSEKHKYE